MQPGRVRRIVLPPCKMARPVAGALPTSKAESALRASSRWPRSRVNAAGPRRRPRPVPDRRRGPTGPTAVQGAPPNGPVPCRGLSRRERFLRPLGRSAVDVAVLDVWSESEGTGARMKACILHAAGPALGKRCRGRDRSRSIGRAFDKRRSTGPRGYGKWTATASVTDTVQAEGRSRR